MKVQYLNGKTGSDCRMVWILINVQMLDYLWELWMVGLITDPFNIQTLLDVSGFWASRYYTLFFAKNWTKFTLALFRPFWDFVNFSLSHVIFPILDLF